MYPDWDTFAKLLPARRIQQHVCLFLPCECLRKVYIYNKALNVWSLGKIVSSVFPIESPDVSLRNIHKVLIVA